MSIKVVNRERGERDRDRERQTERRRETHSLWSPLLLPLQLVSTCVLEGHVDTASPRPQSLHARVTIARSSPNTAEAPAAQSPTLYALRESLLAVSLPCLVYLLRTKTHVDMGPRDIR